jgi:hypothetical protein
MKSRPKIDEFARAAGYCGHWYLTAEPSCWVICRREIDHEGRCNISKEKPRLFEAKELDKGETP